jgi:hypothetical protein
MTGTTLATAAPRLRKLILMLSSSHDGEVVGAARAIARVLQDANADWHALADAISFPNQTHASHLKWQEMARACRMQAHRLSPREFDFINNIALASYEPSEKQLKWLRDIYCRLGGDR